MVKPRRCRGSLLEIHFWNFLHNNFLANTFPTAFSFAQTLVNVSGALASKFVVGAAVGWMTLPSVVGAVFDRYHRIVPMITLCASVINSLIMLTVQYRGEKHKKSNKNTQ